MKHKIGFNRLSRKPAHRKALIKNLITQLFTYERIITTKAKALAARQEAEKMITRAKIDSVHNRRMVGRRITEAAILAKLFVDIGPRFEKRPGGYTRILKIGPRFGDAAEMVVLELVEKKELNLKKTGAQTTEAKAPEAKKDKPAAAEKAAGDKAPKKEKAAAAESTGESKPKTRKAPAKTPAAT